MGLIRILLDLFFPIKCVGCQVDGRHICKSCIGKINILRNQQCPSCRQNRFLGDFCSTKCQKNFYFNNLIVCTEYRRGSLIRDLIKGFKYKLYIEIGEILGGMLLNQFRFYSNQIFDLKRAKVIPIPITKKSFRKRGFNQSLVLSRFLQKRMLSVVNCKKSGTGAGLGFGFSTDSEVSFKSDTVACKFVGGAVCCVKHIERSKATKIDCDFELLDCLVWESGHRKQSELSKEERAENNQDSVYVKKRFVDKLKGQNVILIDDVATTCSTLNDCSRVLKKYGVNKIFCFVISRGKLFC